MSLQEAADRLCEICRQRCAVTRCEECGRALCKECRSMELSLRRDGEVTIKYFCPACGQDPRINPPKACEKVFGLENIADMVNQEECSKSGRFKIKLKIS